MRFLDGEATPEERAAVEHAIETSSEMQREVALFRSIKTGLQDLSFAIERRESGWARVRSRITMPAGWILTVSGVLVWLGYGAWAFVASPSALAVKLGTGGVAIGVLVLLAHVIWDRYKEYGTDPYRDVHR